MRVLSRSKIIIRYSMMFIFRCGRLITNQSRYMIIKLIKKNIMCLTLERRRGRLQAFGLSYTAPHDIWAWFCFHLIISSLCSHTAYLSGLSSWLKSNFPGTTVAILTDMATRDSFYQHGLTFIIARMSNYHHHKVWDKITYPFPGFNSAAVEVLKMHMWYFALYWAYY